jgi:preprotein translocase subunit SecE
VGSTPTTRAKNIRITMAKNKVSEYITESYDELMHKVSWPSWSELQNSAIVVSIASLIIALVVFLMDETFQSLLKQFYLMF